MQFLIQVGWVGLLVAVAGEMLVPALLATHVSGYRPMKQSISALGAPSSPVRRVFAAWMLIAGVLLLLSIPALYSAYQAISRPLTVVCVSCVAVFAVGACVMSAFFPANETKDVETPASRVHGIASAIGFMLMLFVPLMLCILSFMAGDMAMGVLSGVSCVLAFGAFVLFIMADKPVYEGTPIAREGLWQRLCLLLMYVPLAYAAVRHII